MPGGLFTCGSEMQRPAAPASSRHPALRGSRTARLLYYKDVVMHARDGWCAMDSRDEAVRDLTLALMYLTSWTDRPGEMPRCWKGYDFDVLDTLAEYGLISDSRRAKSAYLTDEGIERARGLLARYGIPE